VNACEFNTNVNFNINKFVPIINLDKVELKSYMKRAYKDEGNEDFVESDSVEASSVFLYDLNINDESSASFNIKIEGVSDSQMINSFLIYLQPSIVDGFVLPNWIKENSSTNPSSIRDANKTLNLEYFLNDLIRANSTVNQPKLAKFFVEINKN